MSPILIVANLTEDRRRLRQKDDSNGKAGRQFLQLFLPVIAISPYILTILSGEADLAIAIGCGAFLVLILRLIITMLHSRWDLIIENKFPGD